jgi:hypothetical protein
MPAVKTNRLWIALMALGVNLVITVPLAAVLNIWQDEAYTLETTSRGLGYAFHQAIGFEQNAPLYFVAMSIWRHAGDGVFFLRLFSVLCIAGTVLLLPGLARRYVPHVDGVLVAAVVACNPFVVWASVELRVYALIVLMSALLLRTFFDAFMEENPGKGAAIAYAVCVAVALYTQYYLAFLVAAQGVTLLFYNRRAILRYALAGAAAAVAFVPMLAIVPGQVQNFKSIFAPPSIVQTCINLAGIGLRYVLPLPILHAKNAYVVLVIVAVLAATFARPSLKAIGRSPIVAMTAFAFAFFAVGTYLSGVHVLDRHAAALYVPATLSIFAVLATVRFQSGRRAVLVWSALAMVLSLVTLVETYRHLAKPGDWVRVAEYLRAHERTGEPIAVFEAENALPLAYYYAGANRIVPIPHGVDFQRYDVSRFVIENEAELQSTVPGESRLWLVTSGECASANVQFGCNRLEDFVARRYRIVSDAQFLGTRIRLIERSGGRPGA